MTDQGGQAWYTTQTGNGYDMYVGPDKQCYRISWDGYIDQPIDPVAYYAANPTG